MAFFFWAFLIIEAIAISGAVFCAVKAVLAERKAKVAWDRYLNVVTLYQAYVDRYLDLIQKQKDVS